MQSSMREKTIEQREREREREREEREGMSVLQGENKEHQKMMDTALAYIQYNVLYTNWFL